MGTNQTNKVLDDKKFLTNANKAEKLLNYYKISKNYKGDLGTFLKVMFGKGGAIRLLNSSAQTDESSYFSVLAKTVHAAYIKCKFMNSQLKDSSNKEDLESVIARLKSNIDSIDLEQVAASGRDGVAKLRALETKLSVVQSLSWAVGGIGVALCCTGVGVPIGIALASVSAALSGGAFGGTVVKDDKVVDKAFKSIDTNIAEMKKILKNSQVSWGSAANSINSFFNICASEGEKYCSQKKISRFSRKIDKVKYNVADILKNIKSIKFSSSSETNKIIISSSNSNTTAIVNCINININS